MSKKPTIPRAPLVEKMPVWEYLGYRPWTMAREHDDEVIFLSRITRLSDMPQAIKDLFGNNQRYLNGLCRQNTQAQEARALEELEDAYYSGEFLRDPSDEIRDGPMNAEWAGEEYDHHWKIGTLQELQDTELPQIVKRRQIFEIGRARDLLQETRGIGCSRARDVQIVKILGGLTQWIENIIQWNESAHCAPLETACLETLEEASGLLFKFSMTNGSD